MDKIFFRNFKLNASIGLLPHEKQRKQTLLINLEFGIDASKVAVLADTIDYAKVRDTLIKLIDAKHYDLLECLAELICEKLSRQFNLHWIKLSLEKPDIFDDMEAVGLVIERQVNQ